MGINLKKLFEKRYLKKVFFGSGHIYLITFLRLYYNDAAHYHAVSDDVKTKVKTPFPDVS
ncbi:MAG: hypothetical protein PUG60_00970 [Lachnospiraceae bacterium]|nr:hypothetical protein [Lachnospiraceae bacterium]